MDVSENKGNPQIIHFNRVFHYKPSILGIPLFSEIPIYSHNPIRWDGKKPPGGVHSLAWPRRP